MKYLFYSALGFMLLVVACAFDTEIRVYIDNPAVAEINGFNSCDGITVTSNEEAADFIVTTKPVSETNRFLRGWTALSIAAANGDFIFSKNNNDLSALILDACEAIHSQ